MCAHDSRTDVDDGRPSCKRRDEGGGWVPVCLPASQPTSRSPGYSSTTTKRQRNSSPFLTWAACGGDFRGGKIPTSNCCANSVAQTQFRRRGDRQRARKRPITRRFPYPFFFISISSFLSSHSLVLSLSPGLFVLFFFRRLVTHHLRSRKQPGRGINELTCLAPVGNAGLTIVREGRWKRRRVVIVVVVVMTVVVVVVTATSKESPSR